MAYSVSNKRKKRRFKCEECGEYIEGKPCIIEGERVCKRCYYPKHYEFRKKHKEGKLE